MLDSSTQINIFSNNQAVNSKSFNKIKNNSRSDQGKDGPMTDILNSSKINDYESINSANKMCAGPDMTKTYKEKPVS